MSQTTDNKQLPLWKILNGQRTQGNWKAGELQENNECAVKSGTVHLGSYHAPFNSKANAQYTALSVNNLANLAEKMDALISYCDKIPQFEYSEEIKQAKEALALIS